MLGSNFIRIIKRESLETNPNAASELFHVIRGRGVTRVGSDQVRWEQGDFFTLPVDAGAEHRADEDVAFYWIHDEPLLRYPGVRADQPRFRPTLYPRNQAVQELETVEADPEAKKKSWGSVFLANKQFPQTRTIMHVLWAMFGVLLGNSIQLHPSPQVGGPGLHHRASRRVLHPDRPRG